MNEKVSIIIPVYNVEKYIKDCLQSVAEQSYAGEIECLLIDDRGSDNSIDVAKEFIADYKGSIIFKVLTHEKNAGLSAARNTGLDNATGDYIYFLDSDDFIESNTISDLYAAIKSYNVAISIGYFTTFKDGRDSIYRKDWLFDTSRIIEPEDFVEKMLMEKSNYASTAKLYDARVLGHVRFRLGMRNEDTLFILDLRRVIEEGRLKCVDVPIYTYHYRVVSGSISHTPSRPLAMDVIDNYDAVIYECSDKQLLVDWVRSKQMQVLMGLIYELVEKKSFPYNVYKKYVKKLSTYTAIEASTALSKQGYRNYCDILKAPLLYWCIHRILSLIKNGIFI